MEEFNKMLTSILKRGNDRLSFSTVPEFRLKIIQDTKNELIAMKSMYEAINGPIKPNETTFEQIVKQLN